MSKQKKLVERLQGKPKDFTWDELITLMSGFGFELHSGNGSSRRFMHARSKTILMMHEPHPGSILKIYQVKAVLDFLKDEEYTG